MDFVKHFSTDGFISFSYPNGSYDNGVVDCIKIQGCNVAYTTKEYVVDQISAIDYLRLPRFNSLRKKR